MKTGYRMKWVTYVTFAKDPWGTQVEGVFMDGEDIPLGVYKAEKVERVYAAVAK